METPQAAETNLSRYRNDPVGFCHDILGVEPWERQREIMAALALHGRATVRSCNGAGKTLCASWACLWFLLTRPGSIVVTTAPTARQVKDLLWRRLRTAFVEAKVSLPGRCLTDRLECGTEWYAMGIATDEEVKFQGPHSPAGVLMVGDEASGLKEWVFAAMEGSMTEEGAMMLLIGNPNQAQGTFYESHRTWPIEQRFHISAFDVPEHVLRPDWKGRMLVEWGEESPLYQVRVLGEFPPQAEGSLISLAWAEAAAKRDLPLEEGQAVEIGVDMAAEGGDECVAFVRQGMKTLAMDAWRQPDTMVSAGRIANLARQWGAKKVKVDDIGIGKGTTDQLKQTLSGSGITVAGVNVSEAAFDKERFYNQRSELFWGLAERFKAGEISIPEDTMLIDQLTCLQYTYTPRGQIKLESKPDMKKRRVSGTRWQSPDRADALCLAYSQSGPRWLPGFSLGPARDR
jgi:phage terminase large subunit